MIHRFSALGRKYIFDTDSSALSECDGLAYDAVGLMDEGLDGEAIISSLSGVYNPADIREALEDIEGLKGEGALFTEGGMPALSAAPPPSPLKALCLHASHDCQLRCRYCFAGTGAFHGARSLMSADTGEAALRFLIEHSGEREHLEADFFGGEPLMNLENVKEIVRRGRRMAAEHGKVFHFTMTTNCVDLDDDAIAFINEEMDNCVLSLDGRPEVHDAMRPFSGGGASYDTAVRNALKLVKGRGGKSYYVRGTFTAKNLDFAADVLSLNDAGFEHLSVEPVVLPPDSPLAIRAEHLPAIEAEYERLLEHYLERRKGGNPFTFFHFNVDLENGPCLYKRLSGCGAGNEYLAVTPEGALFPCHQFVGEDAFAIGDVRGGMDEDMRARFAANNMLTKPECASCWAKLLCTGGCAANAYHHSGTLTTPNPVECAMQRKRMECALAALAYDAEHDEG